MHVLCTIVAGTIAEWILCTIRPEDTTYSVPGSAFRKAAKRGTKSVLLLVDALRRLSRKFLGIVVSLVLTFRRTWLIDRSESAVGGVSWIPANIFPGENPVILTKKKYN